MNMIIGSIQSGKFTLRAGVVALCLVMLGAGVFVAGCGKSGSDSGSRGTNDIRRDTHEPPSPKVAAGNPLVTPTGEPDLAELNRCLLRWMVGNRRQPATFEEFAASANMTIPPPPEGMKYSIDKKTKRIVLVKR